MKLEMQASSISKLTLIDKKSANNDGRITTSANHKGNAELKFSIGDNKVLAAIELSLGESTDDYPFILNITVEASFNGQFSKNEEAEVRAECANYLYIQACEKSKIIVTLAGYGFINFPMMRFTPEFFATARPQQ